MIVCPNCNHPNPDGAVQCEACYTPLPATTKCPNCGATVQSDAAFCGQCGYNLHSSATAAPVPQAVAPTIVPDAPVEIPPLVSPDPMMGLLQPDPLGLSQPAPAPVVSNLPPTVVTPIPVAPPAPVPVVQEAPAPAPVPVVQEAPAPAPMPVVQEAPAPAPVPVVQEIEVPVPAPVVPEVQIPVPDPVSVPAPVIEEIEVPIPTAVLEETAPLPPPTNVSRTQLQQVVSRLFHVQTNQEIELPQNISVVHIGKPNDRIPPDIDVSGFPNSEIVSRIHADIRIEGDACYVEDVGSSNGTYINNLPLLPGNRHRLRPGDRISLGKGDLVTFLFQIS
jgi:pSer/pThr/pTyr-binding forkhead associated (FHA) protein